MTSEPVDHYLDTLFDELHGTGAAGRRVLAEAEDHLLSSAAGLMATGVDAEEAQRIAVERFGPVATIAAGVDRSASRDGSRWPEVARAAWLLGSSALIAIGLTGLVIWALTSWFNDGTGGFRVQDIEVRVVTGLLVENIEVRVFAGLIGVLSLIAYRRRGPAGPRRALVPLTGSASFITAISMPMSYRLALFSVAVIVVAAVLFHATMATRPAREALSSQP